MASPDHAIGYVPPPRWILYNPSAIMQSLIDAKVAVSSLRAVPYQRDWVEEMQKLQLKMEVAGTSRIEGADFTDRELDAAMETGETAHDLVTRSQRQARAAAETYRWIATLPDDMSLTEELVREVHRRIVTGCDDDHCAPGKLRGLDENVTFGFPRHRGCEGGPACKAAFSQLVHAVRNEYREHDPLVRAISLHYHFAAMHPFLDGNGRTARALEALILQRAGLRDSAFIAMSNYYHEEKAAYLDVLASVRSAGHDLTAFLVFGLKGVALQCERLFQQIKVQIQIAVFRNVMFDLFNHLQSPRRRVIAERQLRILKLLLDNRTMDIREIIKQTVSTYNSLQNPQKALIRDINDLVALSAIHAARTGKGTWSVTINLDWPQEITATDFMDRVNRMPKSKTHTFL